MEAKLIMHAHPNRRVPRITVSINKYALKKASGIDPCLSLGTPCIMTRAQANIVDPLCTKGSAHSRMQMSQESQTCSGLQTPMSARPCRMRPDYPPWCARAQGSVGAWGAAQVFPPPRLHAHTARIAHASCAPLRMWSLL